MVVCSCVCLSVYVAVSMYLHVCVCVCVSTKTRAPIFCYFGGVLVGYFACFVPFELTFDSNY